MPAWLMPALKAVLPHIGTIISATSPAFTRKAADERERTGLLQEQIAELQAAATANDANIKELAREMKKTVELLDAGVARAEARQQRALVLAAAAAFFSLVSLVCALFALAS